ncbi:MAG: ribosomal-protein-alanine N-acetyltransferase [Clostridiales bacterium GWE2_32_10]|nr:MAG: ribosomal-protein-alanine N-acetyltransferase [Clostridiales bacterium GWE2_32_10]HBY21660.1 ribosomal-protein-alanine N-acetyltransferase [Clostridiales bacterium]
MKFGKILIKRMTNGDINDIVELEKKSFHNPWTKEMFENELMHDNVYYFIAEHNNNLIGYVGFWHIVDEAHVTNICVDSSAQRNGVGMLMMGHLIDFCKSKNIIGVTLEVRKLNEKAINFYHKLGFKNEGIRKNYYSNPQEDAIIMWMKF